jgi:hypothetical protein
MDHTEHASQTEMYCTWCGDDVPPLRWATGRQTCLMCGEEAARLERLSWCIVQEYGKGPYQLITQSAAPTTLRQTNQKNLRG